MNDERYNGWKNRQTWNVALGFQNDEGIYRMALEAENYEALRQELREMGQIETPDGVAYNDSGLDVAELDAAIAELKA